MRNIYPKSFKRIRVGEVAPIKHYNISKFAYDKLSNIDKLNDKYFPLCGCGQHNYRISKRDNMTSICFKILN